MQDTAQWESDKLIRMPQILKYQIMRQGGQESPRYTEILHPRREHGPSLFILDGSTRRLYEHVGTCPTNPGIIVVEPIEDSRLRRIILEDNQQTL